MKKIITFGAGSQDYYDAVNRLTNQIKELNLFNQIYGFTDEDLKKDIEFWNKHGDFIENNKKGYGYWLWKPYIIKKTLEKLNENDILVYLDVGCEINIKQKNKFINFIKLLDKKNILGSSCASNDIKYTKKDILNYFNFDINKDKKLLEKKHMQACILFIKKNDLIINFINEWYDICSNNYNFLDDSESIDNNYPQFVENRHDQSIFNMLVKKYNLLDYSLDPVNFSQSSKMAKKYPIIAFRNKTGKSFL